MLKRIWHFCGDVKVTFWLLLFISFNLALGSYYVRFYPQLFKPLNDFLFQDWFKLHGQNHLDKMWWLGTLFALILILGINTTVCALNRLAGLWPKRKQMGSRIFFLKITPSFIHLCFLVIITGHLLSLIAGSNQTFLIKPGSKISLPLQASVELVDQNCDCYQTPALLKGFIKQCTISLKLQKSEKMALKRISFLHPLFWQGFSFHLNMAKKPDKFPELKLHIKRDPGLKLILPGFTVMVLLMLWYFPQTNKNKK